MGDCRGWGLWERGEKGEENRSTEGRKQQEVGVFAGLSLSLELVLVWQEQVWS